MNLITIAVTSFIIALSGALVPGPLFTITVSESVRRGFIAGPLIILGHGILELLIVVALLFGITPVLNSGSAAKAIGILGGTALILMGIMILKDAGRATIEPKAGKSTWRLHPVLTGIVGSLSNPYWVIWWVTIGLGYLLSSLKFGIIGVVAFFLGHILADLAWYSIVSFAVSKGRKIMGNTGYRFLLGACGVFLVCFGGWFIASV